MTAVVYVLREKSVAKPLKIGTDTKWPLRFRAAASHTPRDLEAAAIWSLPGAEAARVLDATFRRALTRSVYATRALEWYDLTLDEAVRQVEPMLPGGSTLTLAPAIPSLGRALWDDWREIRPKYRSYRWRTWIFQEDSPERRVKVSYGALYDTHFRYAFTYNPWPVFLVGGMEHPQGTTANDGVADAWTDLVCSLGRGSMERAVGWLRPGVEPAEAAAFLATRSLVPFSLSRPKPVDAPARESSINAIAYGAVPPQAWVRDLLGGT